MCDLMKPRIILGWRGWVNGERWECHGKGYVGYGRSPRQAYDQWERLYNESRQAPARLPQDLFAPARTPWYDQLRPFRR